MSLRGERSCYPRLSSVSRSSTKQSPQFYPSDLTNLRVMGDQLPNSFSRLIYRYQWITTNKTPIASRIGVNCMLWYQHVSTFPCSEGLVNPTWAGDLAGEFTPLQLRDSAGLCTGFAFEPSHPGDMAPKLEDMQLWGYFISDWGGSQEKKCWSEMEIGLTIETFISPRIVELMEKRPEGFWFH